MNFEIRHRNILSCLILLLLSSCNQKEEVVSFDELSSNSEKYNGKDSIAKNVKNELFYYDSISSLSQNLIDSLGFDKNSIFGLDSVLFSDRFGSKRTEKWYSKSDKDSLVFFHWEFKDSIKTFNTFYNWLDCYGENCKSIVVGQETSFSKRATLFLIQDKHLFFVESNLKIDYERLLSVFDNLNWTKNWKYVVYQAPRKKANWMKRDLEGKLN